MHKPEFTCAGAAWDAAALGQTADWIQLHSDCSSAALCRGEAEIVLQPEG